MDEGNRTAARGLLRLLATHVVLRHQTGVFLWSFTKTAQPKLCAVLQENCAGLDTMIQDIGRTSAEMETGSPWALARLIGLSSIDAGSEQNEASACLAAIRASHQQIIEDIGTLQVLIALDQPSPVNALLVGIHAQHAEWRAKLDGARQLNS